MRKKKFTLVEMLTVIAIIGVLAGILIPTIMVSKRRAQEATAKTEVNSIVAAIKAYRQQYNKLPTTFANANGEVTNYVDFMIMLCGGTDDKKPAIKKANPRKTKFLTPRATKDDNMSVAEEWLDPWGKQYRIFLDENYDGKVDVNADSGNDALRGDVFVYSMGLDREDDPKKSNNVDKNKDNVTSWDKK